MHFNGYCEARDVSHKPTAESYNNKFLALLFSLNS